MINRIVPFLAILCIIIVAVMSLFLWRDAENEPSETPSYRESHLQKLELMKEHSERAEQYARQAEAAALRAETILETLLLVETRVVAAQQAAAERRAATEATAADTKAAEPVQTPVAPEQPAAE